MFTDAEFLTVESENLNCLDSRQFFQLLMDSHPHAVFMIDTDFQVISSNRNADQYFKVSVDEKKLKKCFQLMGNTEICNSCLCQKASLKGSVQKELVEIPGKQMVEVSCFPVKNQSKIIGYFLILRDDSDLILSAERFFSLFQDSRDAIMLLEDGRFTDCNRAALELFGCSSKDQFIATSPWDFSPKLQPDGNPSKPAAMEKIRQAFLLGSNFFDWLHCRHSGETFPAEVQLSVVSTGDKKRLQAVVRDVSSRKRQEEMIRSSSLFLETIIDTIPGPIFWKNSESLYLGCNQAFAETVIGKPREEIIGKSMVELAGTIPEDLAEKYKKMDFELFESDTTQVYESDVRCSDGNIRRFRFYKAVYKNIQQNQKGIVGVMLDITELNQAREDAERASQMKTIFLSNISHEVRTPMNVVLSYAELLRDYTELSVEQLKFVNQILNSGTHLLEIINDLLDMARIEAGELSITLSEISTRDIVEELAESFRGRLRITGKPVLIRTEYNKILEDRFVSDKLRVRQILLNFLGNAVKFTESGEILIQAEMTDSSLILSVSDTGIGMSEEKLADLFRRFNQTCEEITQKYGGSGLGLSISRTLAEMLGGRVSVESIEGKGSKFMLILPRQGA